MNVLPLLTKLAMWHFGKPNIVGKETGFKATAMSLVPLGPLLHTHLADPHNNEIQQTTTSFYILHPDLKFVGTVGTGGPVKFFLSV